MTPELDQIVRKLLESGDLNALSANELTLCIKIEGDGFDSSITGEVARAMWAMQENVYRAAAQVLHGEPNIKMLTASERAQLCLNFKVHEGCTNALVNVKDAAIEIAKGFREMESKDKKAVFLTFVIGSLLCFTIDSIAKAVCHYLGTKSAETSMVEQARVLAGPINKAMELSAQAIAKSTQGASSTQIGDYRYDAGQIQRLNQKAERQPATTDTYDASFNVHGVELVGNKLKVTLIDDSNGATIAAMLPGKDLFDEPLPNTAREVAELIGNREMGVRASILTRETKTKVERVIVSWVPFNK